MSDNAFCGRNASLTLNGSAVSGVFRVGFTSTGNEEDISAYGSGDYGDWIVCTKEGELTIESYAYLGTGAETFAITAGGTTFSGTCEPRSFASAADAKGVVTYRMTLSLTGGVTAS